MHHWPKSTRTWKMKTRGMMKYDVTGVTNITSYRKSHSSLKWASSFTSPSTSAHVWTTRPKSNRADIRSPRVSPVSPKNQKRNECNLFRRWGSVSRKNTRDVRGSNWATLSRPSVGLGESDDFREKYVGIPTVVLMFLYFLSLYKAHFCATDLFPFSMTLSLSMNKTSPAVHGSITELVLAMRLAVSSSNKVEVRL